MLQPSQRFRNLGPYILAQVFADRDAELRRGVDVIDLGVGNPDRRPAPHIVQALKDALDDPAHQYHRYPGFGGLPEFKQAMARWYERRFGVQLDPAREVLPLIGSKEGIVKFFLAHLDPGDTVLLTTPCYPAYHGACELTQVKVHDVPLGPATEFRPDWSAVPAAVADAAKLLTVNYPHNPTGQVETAELYERTLEFALRHDVCVVSDIAYCDLSLEPSYRARSFLEFDRDKRTSIEFHSFSKTFSMQGWRVAFCAGNAELVANLAKIKSHMDFSIFLAIQKAAAAALDGPQDYPHEISGLYRRRRDAFLSGIAPLGWRVAPPQAGMYVWLPIPAAYADCLSFTRDLLQRTGVLVAPGVAFGAGGEGFVRVALCEEEDRIREACARLERAGVHLEMARA
jgi:LL-diaminopimelate aminotransferase